MNQVFLDTVGMIAVWDDTDQWHVAARAAYGALLGQGRRLVATSFVLCECGNAAARRDRGADKRSALSGGRFCPAFLGAAQFL